MAKIIQFDSSGKKPKPGRPGKKPDCLHRRVIAYTVYRTVRCEVCGMELDPFDVLVDMLKGQVPPDDGNREEKRLHREIARRGGKKSRKGEPSRKE